MKSLGFCILLALIIIVFCSNRRWALLGMLVGLLYLTTGQYFVFYGLHLHSFRLLELAAFIRVIVRRELPVSKISRIDKLYILVHSSILMIFLFRSTEYQAYQVGIFLDSIVGYFAFKGIIQDLDDLIWCLKVLIVFFIPFVLSLLVERFTGYNIFSEMGDKIGYDDFTRYNKIRCFGSFSHPTLLGTFGSIFLAFYIGLCLLNENKIVSIIGAIICLIVIWLSNSGGPILTTITVLIGWSLWPLRSKMKFIKLGLLGILLFLILYMKAPIWYIMDRLSSLSGGSGWHRSKLIDVFIENIDQWWLMGMSIKDTVEWLPYILSETGGADITNQFVLIGISAGIFPLLLFLILLTYGYTKITNSILKYQSINTKDTRKELVLWTLGVVFFANIVSWLGISYFDKTRLLWFFSWAVLTKFTEDS